MPKGSNRGDQVDIYTGNRAEPWCAHFVAWLYRQIQLPLPDDKQPSPKQHNPIASVSHLERCLRELGWLYREPKVGDLVFYATRGKSDAGPGRHIGLVVQVVGDTIHTIEANWGDRVARRQLKSTDPTITGYGRHPGLE